MFLVILINLFKRDGISIPAWWKGKGWRNLNNVCSDETDSLRNPLQITAVDEYNCHLAMIRVDLLIYNCTAIYQLEWYDRH